MAAHKPVEWVQAVINRFDEQVKGQIWRGGLGGEVSAEDGVYLSWFLSQLRSLGCARSWEVLRMPV